MDTAFDAEDDALVAARNGLYATIAGLISMTMGMIMVCSCYTSSFFGVMSGAAAVFFAYGALQHQPAGEARAYANVGLWSGIIGFIINLMFMVIMGLYLAFYLLLLVAMLIDGQF